MKTKTKAKFFAVVFAVTYTIFIASRGIFVDFDVKFGVANAQRDDVSLIASFTTYYGDSTQNRKDNISLAASKINGCKLYPEDEFSFNDIVGPRTKENGFKSAFVIVDGEYVEGIGGGVCQVSSTLYNCALLSNLAITCVRAHSLAVSYVAPSFDAMVSTASDLRFVNTLGAPITINMTADDKYLTAKIYGVGKFDIKRRSQTIEIIPFETNFIFDETLSPDQEVVDTYGKEGMKTEGYLDYYQDGQLAGSILIRKDIYYPQKRIILRGTPLTAQPD